MTVGNLLLPLLGLLGFASCGRPSSAQAIPAANANRRRTPTPNDPKAAEETRQQRAAVDAAVSRAVREEVNAPPKLAPEAKQLLRKVKAAQKPKPVARSAVSVLKALKNKNKPKPVARPAANVLNKLRGNKTPPPAHTSSESAHAAAVDLAAYLKSTKRFGSKNDRPPEVVAYQRAMGLKPDGIVGPGTRKRASELGVKLPTR